MWRKFSLQTGRTAQPRWQWIMTFAWSLTKQLHKQHSYGSPGLYCLLSLFHCCVFQPLYFTFVWKRYLTFYLFNGDCKRKRHVYFLKCIPLNCSPLSFKFYTLGLLLSFFDISGQLYAFGKKYKALQTVWDHLAKALISPIIQGLAQFREVRAWKHI